MRDYPPAHAWRLPIGANPVPGGTHFRVWAADARDVAVALFEGDRIVATHTLAPEANGYFAATVPGVEPGARYTVAPRLVAGLAGGALAAPLGGAVWGDTWLALPTEMAGRRYHHWLTGEILPVQIFEGQPGLPLAAICAHLPLALLVLLDDR